MVVDIGAATHLARQVALDRKLVDGRDHRVAGHRQIMCQHAARRKSLAGGQLSIEDGATQGLVHLAVQRQIRVPVLAGSFLIIFELVFLSFSIST